MSKRLDDIRKKQVELTEEQNSVLIEQELRDKGIIDLLIKAVTYVVQGNFGKALTTVGTLLKKAFGVKG